MSGFASLAGKHGITVPQVNQAWKDSQAEAVRKGLKKGTEGHSAKTMQVFRAKLKKLGTEALEAKQQADTVQVPVRVSLHDADENIVDVKEQSVPFDSIEPQHLDDATWHGNS